MNNELNSLWAGFSASIIGSGHVKRGLPCQDASAVVTSPRPALIVCDGRGSASRSQDGASAAIRDFTTQCAIFEPMLAAILDADKADSGRWEQFCRILYRTLMQTKLNLASDCHVPEKEFDFTVAAAVIGTNWIGCFQVGDGAIVLRQDGIAKTAFAPDKGEFANQTHFLRENGEARGRFHAKLFSARENSGIAITSDGPEYLMFHLATMTPGRIFDMFFDDMQNRSLSRQDIMDYLTRREWDKDPRGQDDRSIAILAPEAARQESEYAPEAARQESGLEAEDVRQESGLEAEDVRQESGPEVEDVRQESECAPEDARQDFEPEAEDVRQDFEPEAEDVRQDSEPAPQTEAKKTADEPIAETSATPQLEAKKVEESPTPIPSVLEPFDDGSRNDAESNNSAEPEKVSPENRIVLISSGITGAAIIALLLSTIYYQSEINAMQHMLETASVQQRIIVEHLPQPVDTTAAERLPQPVDATAAERLPQPDDATAAERLPQSDDATAAEHLSQPVDATHSEDASDNTNDPSETESRGYPPKE